MIEANYLQTASTKRITPGDGIVEGEQPYLSGIPCTVQPNDESFTQDLGGQFGKDFLMFCGVVDILENDKVTVDGVDYKVVGLEVLHHPAGNDHLEVRIRMFQQ